MINKLNLSSTPFRNRTLPWLLSVFLFLLSAIGLIYFWSEWQNLKAMDEVVKGNLKEMEEKIKTLKGRGEEVQQALTPEERQTLIAAHKLVARKGFAWSRLLSDLEQLLPRSVSVSRINVQNVYRDVNGNTKADLEFGVLSRDYQSVINMIDNMNNSGIFQAELRGQDLQRTETITYSEYNLRLIYLPRSGVSNTTPETEIAVNNEESNR